MSDNGKQMLLILKCPSLWEKTTISLYTNTMLILFWMIKECLTMSFITTNYTKTLPFNHSSSHWYIESLQHSIKSYIL